MLSCSSSYENHLTNFINTSPNVSSSNTLDKVYTIHRMPFKSKFADVKPDERFKELVSNFFWFKLDQFKTKKLFVDHQTKREWTGDQIKWTSSLIARALIRDNAEADRRNCVTFYKHCDWLQLVALGVLFAGGSVCAGFDSDPEHEHCYMLEVIKPAFVFIGRDLLEEMLKLRAQVCPFTIILMDDNLLSDSQFGELHGANSIVLGLQRHLLAETNSNLGAQIELPIQVEPNKAAFVLLTSGSTGRPKPVCRSQRNCLYVCHNFVGAESLWDLNETSVVAAHLALDHGTGIFHLKQCLAQGYKSIIMNGYHMETMLEAIETYKISDVILGSALVHNLLSSQEIETKLARGALGSLRNLIAVGSSIASGETVRNFMRRLPGCSVRQAFGMTEASFVSVVPRELGGQDLHPNCVGLMLPNVEIKLICRNPQEGGSERELDGTGQEITAFDQLGELYVRSPTVSPGYVGAHFSEQARDCFLPDGFYKSNDVCSMGSADEMLRVMGRFSEVLCLCDGWKVLPNEIEHTILEHPHVKEAAVVGVPHPSLPTCHAPRAYVVAREDVEVVESDREEEEEEEFDETRTHKTGANHDDDDEAYFSQFEKPASEGSVGEGSRPGVGRAATPAGSNSISRRQLFDFVAERLSEPKHLVGGIKFLSELPKISIGKIDKRKLKAADGLV